MIGQACLEPLTDFARISVGDPGEEFRVDGLARLGFPAAAGAIHFAVLARLPAAFDGVDSARDFGFEGGLKGVLECPPDLPVRRLQSGCGCFRLSGLDPADWVGAGALGGHT